MRTFKLDRHEDLSGNSGTGIVAEGAEFSDGTVALRWLTDSPTSTFYNSMDDVMKLHHHDGATEVIFDDEEPSKKGAAMKPSIELRKLAAKLAQTAPLSVGGFYPDGREFGQEFWDMAEARDYFDAAKDWAASVSLYESEGDGETEIDSWARDS